MDELDSDANIPSHSYREVVVTPISMLVLSLITILLRCWVKGKVLRNFALDDWLLVASFIIYATLCILAICSASYGFGVHSVLLPKHNLVIIYHLWFFEEIAYLLATIILKLSISILLLRLVATRTNRLVIYSTAVFYTTTGIVSTFGIIFQCWPISRFWTDDDVRTSSCINENVLGRLAYFHATGSLVTDLIFTIIPTSVVWGLGLERSAKISVSIVLCFGFLASSVNMARYDYIENLASPGDNSFDYFVIGMVSILELGFGIIAASLATCRPLLRIIFQLCLRYTQPQNTTNEQGLGGSSQMRPVLQQSRSSAGVGKGSIGTGTVRSQQELEEDIRVWGEICVKTQEMSALMNAPLDIEANRREQGDSIQQYRG